MSPFVTLADYKPKPAPRASAPEGTGHFTAKKPPAPASQQQEGKNAGENSSDDSRSQAELAAARVAKFVPSLILLGYAGLCNLVNSKDPAHEADLRLILFKVAFWICAVLTPIYIAYFDRKNVKALRWMNVIVGTIAFPIWAYAFPCGWFYEVKYYDAVIAGFALIVFSLLTAFLPAPKLDGA